MKKNKFILYAFCLLSFCSCEFLDREPIDFGNEDTFFKDAEELKYFVNDLYDIFPKNNAGWGGLYTEDVNSDNQCAPFANQLFYKGDKKTVKVKDSQWNFHNLKSINFYINKVEGLIHSGSLDGNDALIRHYLGEGYFLRAYDYFRLLKNFGDVPIVTEMLPDDQSVLTAHSKRDPRNKVARFILSDLKKAADLMAVNAPEYGRVSKDAAYAFMSRVALYEGTWERYHANTCFVPGNSKWLGSQTWPDFQFESGSAENEVNFFLDEAIKASQLVADKRALDKDYQSMFNQVITYPNDDEVIFARYYQKGVIAHSCSAYLKSGGGCNVTRAAVNTFLMTNGLPIYNKQSGYKGDTISYYELQERDSRLTQSVRAAGRIINTHNENGTFVNDTVFFYKPYIYLSGKEKATTGYELQKWCSQELKQQVQYDCTTSVPILRAAECYLNYIEAYYERYGQLGGNCDKYWRALRQRAGVDDDYQKTIVNTDLAQENDLAIYSHGNTIDPTLYNIRRERRCELIAEGLRLDDLKRWRSLDNMVKYQPEGINLWDKMYEMYSSGEIDEVIVSQSYVSKYIRPLQISSTSVAYGGYDFPKPHYLEPIPISEFLLTQIDNNGHSILTQNPGWPSKADGTADYDYNCD